VGRTGQGNSFGELALLYSCPRAATVKATVDTNLFRVDQKTFRFILQNQTIQGLQTKGELLQGVDFLKDLDATELLKLASVMTPKRFTTGDYLIRKGEIGEYFYLLSEGTLQVKDIGAGDSKYEDAILEVGQYVGERALVTGEPRAANVVAKTDGMAFCIDKNTFDTTLGQLSVLIIRSQDKTKLVRIYYIGLPLHVWYYTWLYCVCHITIYSRNPLSTLFFLIYFVVWYQMHQGHQVGCPDTHVLGQAHCRSNLYQRYQDFHRRR
jgi:cAMP-dependent protein kinase regulator